MSVEQPGAGVPPGLGDLTVVAVDLGRAGVRTETEHQTGRKRPRLAAEIGGRVDVDADLLVHLAADRGLQRLPRLDEAGQRREPALRPGGLPPEQQAVVVVDHQHDHGGVGPRVVLAAVFHTSPRVPGILGPGVRPAPRAVHVRDVPVRQRDGVHDKARLQVVEPRADLAQPEKARCVLVPGVRTGLDGCEVGRTLERAEEDPAVLRHLRTGAQVKPRRVIGDRGPSVAQQQHPGARVGPGRRQPRRVGTTAGVPVDDGAGKGEVGQGTHRVSVRARSSHRCAAASAPLSSRGISTFSFGACQPSSGRLTPRNTTGAPVASCRSASGPEPPSRV